MARAIATGVVANKNPLVFTDCYAMPSSIFLNGGEILSEEVIFLVFHDFAFS